MRIAGSGATGKPLQLAAVDGPGTTVIHGHQNKANGTARGIVMRAVAMP
jgi:hypothetical protein